jgi:hypothetical protein
VSRGRRGSNLRLPVNNAFRSENGQARKKKVRSPALRDRLAAANVTRRTVRQSTVLPCARAAPSPPGCTVNASSRVGACAAASSFCDATAMHDGIEVAARIARFVSAPRSAFERNALPSPRKSTR